MITLFFKPSICHTALVCFIVYLFILLYVADVYYDVSLYVYCKPIASIAHVLYTDTQAYIHRYEIGCQLLLITNSKSHTGFRLVPTSMILNDLERRNSPYFAFLTEFDRFSGR